jgi:hypothetical protein
MNDTTTIPERLCVRLTAADRRGLEAISATLKVPHRDAVRVTEAIRAAISIASASITTTTV